VKRLLLKPEEAAAALGIGRSKLYELLSAGRIPSVKVDGSRRIALADLEAFVESLRTSVDAEAPSFDGGQLFPTG